jgi:glycosyltransferase involved in cell wall biosynthesis
VPLIQAWRGHAEITLVCGYRPQEQDRIGEARALVSELFPVSCPARRDLGALGRAAETVRTAYCILTRRDPIHATKLDRAEFHRAIRDARARTRVDVAQVELAGLARCVDELRDLPSVLVDHEAGAASGGDLRSDARSLRYIRAIYPRFSRVLALCREDAAELQAELPKTQVGVRPPGISVPERRRPTTAPGTRRPTTSAGSESRRPTTSSAVSGTVLFFGSPDHVPNKDALDWLARDLWPRISNGAPGARCVAIGGISSPDLARRVEAAGIENRGFVPDLAAELAKATVVVCPVRLGRGVRMKNLEALAAGRPLVTTKLGARGLDLVDGDDALVVDGAAGFAAAVVRVLKDPDLASRLSATGCSHVARSFTHEAAASFNLALWKSLVSA